MALAYLDTQVAVWLFNRDLKKLSREALRLIDSRDLLLAPMVYLEFDYLRRSKRVRHSPAEIFLVLHSTLNVNLCQLSFAPVAELAAEIGWTTDPFDRLITAQAWANQSSTLITADERVREHYTNAAW